MFYSHEILTNHQYGVATVWLVSTIGLRSSTRKISRKAIQEVNVKKACETILQPDAPIALRLQGRLLYGLSRVYSQQCHYVLTDAEKVQAHMMAFWTSLRSSDDSLDPEAGKSKRKELVLPDDPNFDLNINLPALEFDENGNLVALQLSQTSRKTSSQLSPLQSNGSFLSFHHSPIGGFNLSQSISPGSGGNYLLPDPLDQDSMTPDKGNDGLLPFDGEERDLQAVEDVGIIIDTDGNAMVMEPPEVLHRSSLAVQEEGAFLNQPEKNLLNQQGDVVIGGSDAFAMHSDPVQLERPAEQERQKPEQVRQEVAVEGVNSSQPPVRNQRRRRRPMLIPDDQTKITRQELKSWSADYLTNAERATHPRSVVTPAEARRNAFDLVFGRGIGGIGFPTGVPGLVHPLADQFAGLNLQATLLGVAIIPNNTARGRRRTALEALGFEEGEHGRRVRPRLSAERNNDEEQAAQKLLRHDEDAPGLLLNDDELPPIELGRRAGSVLGSDNNPPSDLPWNRPSSQVPSSSIKAGSRAGSRQVSASPLHYRGSMVIPGPEIERYSDQPVFGSDDVAPVLHSGAPGISSSPPRLAFEQDFFHHHHGHGEASGSASQGLHSALDSDGRKFFEYLVSLAREWGVAGDELVIGAGGKHKHRWITFDELFPDAASRTCTAAALAFHHVLTLATKNLIRVSQEGQGGPAPFGMIRVGVEVPFETHRTGVHDGYAQEGEDMEVEGHH